MLPAGWWCDPSPLFSTREATTGPLATVLGSPVEEGHGHNGANLVKGHEHDEGLGACELRGCLERLWSLSLGDNQNPTKRNPEQVALGDPALSRGHGLDNLQMSFSPSVVLWFSDKYLSPNEALAGGLCVCMYVCVCFQWERVRKHMCVYGYGRRNKASNTLSLLKYYLILLGLFFYALESASNHSV